MGTRVAINLSSTQILAIGLITLMLTTTMFTTRMMSVEDGSNDCVDDHAYYFDYDGDDDDDGDHDVADG